MLNSKYEQINDKNEFYEGIEKVSQTLISFVQACTESKIIKNYCLQFLDSFAYSNLVLNFFNNLNANNVIEAKLPPGMIKKIKNEYANTIKETNLVLKRTMPNKKINQKYYQTFKRDIKKNFSGFIAIIYGVEKIIDIKYLEIILKRKKMKIKKTKSAINDFETNLHTAILEQYIINGKLPLLKKDIATISTAFRNTLDASIQYGMKILEKNSKKTVAALNKDRKMFEEEIYATWKEPLDLMSLLINTSIEIGQGQRTKHLKDSKIISPLKREVLFRIHARAIQIANEILSLLRSGYTDGANARWRTLYELTAIFLILKANDDSLTRSYLDHSVIKLYKELSDFQEYHSKLHQSPISKKEAKIIEDEYRVLKNKYGKNFRNFKRDYGWIPSQILKDCSFKALSKKVEIDHYLPFYNSSLNAAHGGSRGFYRMGLTNRRQNKVLLAGPSIYGLADPLQDTAYCIILLDAVLLSIKKDYQNVFFTAQLKFFDGIGKIAVGIQNSLGKKM